MIRLMTKIAPVEGECQHELYQINPYLVICEVCKEEFWRDEA